MLECPSVDPRNKPTPLLAVAWGVQRRLYGQRSGQKVGPCIAPVLGCGLSELRTEGSKSAFPERPIARPIASRDDSTGRRRLPSVSKLTFVGNLDQQCVDGLIG
jgi:hypothetical protein